MKFKGVAKSVGICILEVEVDSLKEATKKIHDADGGDFEEVNSYFQIERIEEV